MRRSPSSVTFGVVTRLGLQLDLAVFGDVDLQLLVENDSLLREVIAGPELARSQRTGDGADEAVLQHIARTQRRHADVLLVIVGINRSVGEGEVLHRRLLRINHGAVGLAHADVGDLQLVAQRAVAYLELTQRLHAALADDLDLRLGLVAAGAVVLKTHSLLIVLDHIGFLRIVGRSGSLSRSGLCRVFPGRRWGSIFGGRRRRDRVFGRRRGCGGRCLLRCDCGKRKYKEEKSGES